MSPRAFVALGSNLGDRAAHLAFARRRLASLPDSRLRGASMVEETPPLGDRLQPRYLNQMVAVDTTLPPAALLVACHEIEREAGRERRERWAPRTLDLDLVAYGDLQLDTGDLRLPHPGLADRSFWQRELDELRRLGL
ncbi:MAG: 2-amino-4-hydroxy-6-hydroxymethyldihydropteridine diphosphokinase [Gemmatimonadales bacterium]